MTNENINWCAIAIGSLNNTIEILNEMTGDGVMLSYDHFIKIEKFRASLEQLGCDIQRVQQRYND